MFDKVKIIFLFIFLTILQISFFSNLFIKNVSPNIIFVFLIIISFKKKFSDIWFLVITGGLILDLFFLYPIGVNITTFLIISFLISYLSEKFFVIQKKGIIIIILLTIFGTILNHIGNNFILSINNYDSSAVFNIFRKNSLFFEILSNIIILPFAYGLVYYFRNILKIEEDRVKIN